MSYGKRDEDSGKYLFALSFFRYSGKDNDVGREHWRGGIILQRETERELVYAWTIQIWC